MRLTIQLFLKLRIDMYYILINATDNAHMHVHCTAIIMTDIIHPRSNNSRFWPWIASRLRGLSPRNWQTWWNQKFELVSVKISLTSILDQDWNQSLGWHRKVSLDLGPAIRPQIEKQTRCIRNIPGWALGKPRNGIMGPPFMRKLYRTIPDSEFTSSRMFSAFYGWLFVKATNSCIFVCFFN